MGMRLTRTSPPARRMFSSYTFLHLVIYNELLTGGFPHFFNCLGAPLVFSVVCLSFKCKCILFHVKIKVLLNNI